MTGVSSSTEFSAILVSLWCRFGVTLVPPFPSVSVALAPGGGASALAGLAVAPPRLPASLDVPFTASPASRPSPAKGGGQNGREVFVYFFGW